jgi:hypothetical protein
LEIDAVVELPDETWAAFEIKLGSSGSIDEAANNLQKLLRASRRKKPPNAPRSTSSLPALSVLYAQRQSKRGGAGTFVCLTLVP